MISLTQYLTFDYETAHLNINTDTFLPCPTAKLKKLFDGCRNDKGLQIRILYCQLRRLKSKYESAFNSRKKAFNADFDKYSELYGQLETGKTAAGVPISRSDLIRMKSEANKLNTDYVKSAAQCKKYKKTLEAIEKDISWLKLEWDKYRSEFIDPKVDGLILPEDDYELLWEDMPLEP